MTDKNLIKKIIALKEQKNAIILAHYYQPAEIQDIADYTGDSFALSKKAAETEADIIVFCGVHFMAETAKILSPDKTVLLPAKDAGCPMADMASAYDLERYRKAHPERKIVSYVNTTAEVKAQSDVCVTSSNAEKIITAFKGEKILYVPDKNIGNYLKYKYALDIDIWPGFCCIHNNLTVAQVTTMREKYPDAAIIVHPEAPLDVLLASDFIGSTSALIEYAGQTDKKIIVVGTETGILHPMRKRWPDKTFIPLTESLLCKNMKKIDLKTLYAALRDLRHQIHVSESIRQKAHKALDRMMKMS